MVEVAQSVAVGACTGGCSHGNRQDVERGHEGMSFSTKTEVSAKA